MMNIGQAAQATGLSAKMLRHYEHLGLLPTAKRTDSGYRFYTESDLHTLRFIKQARLLGFSLEEIKVLLSLWQDKTRSSREVKQLAEKHIAELQQRVTDLNSMIQSLSALTACCQGNERPECPILDALATKPLLDSLLLPQSP